MAAATGAEALVPKIRYPRPPTTTSKFTPRKDKSGYPRPSELYPDTAEWPVDEERYVSIAGV